MKAFKALCEAAGVFHVATTASLGYLLPCGMAGLFQGFQQSEVGALKKGAKGASLEVPTGPVFCGKLCSFAGCC